MDGASSFRGNVFQLAKIFFRRVAAVYYVRGWFFDVYIISLHKLRKVLWAPKSQLLLF